MVVSHVVVDTALLRYNSVLGDTTIRIQLLVHTAHSVYGDATVIVYSVVFVIQLLG